MQKNKDKKRVLHERARCVRRRAKQEEWMRMVSTFDRLIVELDLDGRLHRSLVVRRLVRQAVHAVSLSLHARAELHQLLCEHTNNDKGQQQQEERVSTPHWVQCMKYSPNGHVLAVGTHGAVIVLLDTRDEYRVRGVLSAHESFITALDFSDDGAFLASTDGLYHLKFHQLFEGDLAQSSLVLDHRLVRDAKWAGQNCVLGFAVQGILETGEAEGYLINAIEVSPSRAFVVSGDDAGQEPNERAAPSDRAAGAVGHAPMRMHSQLGLRLVLTRSRALSLSAVCICLLLFIFPPGQVQLFRFPVLEKGHQSHSYHSHASHVVAVRWSLDEKYVISAGGHDNTLCQWQLY